MVASVSVNHEPQKLVNYWWLRGSEQFTNFFEVRFFADVSHAKNDGFFVFGFEASQDLRA